MRQMHGGTGFELVRPHTPQLTSHTITIEGATEPKTVHPDRLLVWSGGSCSRDCFAAPVSQSSP